MTVTAAPIAFIGPLEGLVLLLVILVIMFGSRAQDFAGQAGKALGEFSRSKQQVEKELENEFEDVRKDVEEIKNDVDEDLEDVKKEMEEIESAVSINPNPGGNKPGSPDDENNE